MTVRPLPPHRTKAALAGAVQVGALLSSLLLPAAAWADCTGDMAALAAKRAPISAALDANKKAHGGRLDPVAACPQLRALAAAEASMVSYMRANKDWCSVPDSVLTQSTAVQAQLSGFAVKACGMIAKLKEMQAKQAAAAAQQQQAEIPALKLPAGPL